MAMKQISVGYMSSLFQKEIENTFSGHASLELECTRKYCQCFWVNGSQRSNIITNVPSSCQCLENLY